MAIKRIKWTQLVTQLDAQDILDDTAQELEYIDDKINALTGSMASKELKDLMKYVDDYHLKPSDSLVWKDLDIYVSSFKENDRRFILLLKNKLRDYIGFYRKILTDTGIQRALVYAKSYENDGNSSSIERGTDSVTPQNSNLYDSEHPESDALFDQAIADFASSIDKNKASSSSHSEGGSTTNVTGVTWEEGKKNLQLVFYNELKDYIMSLPERIYSYYSIDTIPAPELLKKFAQHLREVKGMADSDE